MTNNDIQLVLQALNTITVSGSQNMNTLLGVIQFLEKKLQEQQQIVAEEQPIIIQNKQS